MPIYYINSVRPGGLLPLLSCGQGLVSHSSNIELLDRLGRGLGMEDQVFLLTRPPPKGGRRGSCGIVHFEAGHDRRRWPGFEDDRRVSLGLP